MISELSIGVLPVQTLSEVPMKFAIFGLILLTTTLRCLDD